MLQEAGITGVRALLGGYARWVRETNLIAQGASPR
jgi:hypothetical protein